MFEKGCWVKWLSVCLVFVGNSSHLLFSLVISHILFISHYMLYFHINFCSLLNFTVGSRRQSIPGKQQLLSLLPVPSMNNHYIIIKKETLFVRHSYWNSFWMGFKKALSEPKYQTISLSRLMQVLSQPCRLLSFKLILKSNGEQNVLTVHE